ncbi:Uncharacterized protein DAT39_005741, partial [Clarias magur]
MSAKVQHCLAEGAVCGQMRVNMHLIQENDFFTLLRKLEVNIIRGTLWLVCRGGEGTSVGSGRRFSSLKRNSTRFKYIGAQHDKRL